MMIKCKKCGKEIFEGSTFCNYCGTKIEEAKSVDDSAVSTYRTNDFSEYEEKETGSCFKWILICFAALLVVLLFAWNMGACSTASSEEVGNNRDNSIARNQDNSVTFSTDPLYDENGITIYLKEINETDSFSIEVNNHSGKDILFSLNSIAVNNCKIGYLNEAETITTGNKSIVTCDIYSSEFYGIDVVQTIDFSFSCKDEDYNIVSQSICHVETSAFTNDIHHLDYEQYEKVYEDEKLDVFKVSEGNKIDDFSFLYYNKSSEVIDIVDITDVSINGIMIENYNTKSSVSSLLPGCIAYTDAEDGTILLASSLEAELEEKNILDVKRFQGKVNYLIGYEDTTSELITIK